MVPQSQYSTLWYRTFMDTIPTSQTAIELDFLQRQLPLEEFPRVLDLCCGSGRHAVPLAERGYAVTGIERDPDTIERARRAAPSNATFIQADVRSIPELIGVWDAVLIMWASFGYFSAAENAALIEQMHRLLRPGGRFVLDIYNYDFFINHLGELRRTRNGLDIVEKKSLDGRRLTVELTYHGHDVTDRFDWQIFQPDELVHTVARAGFELATLCAGFDERIAATAEQPRMQLVMQRVAPHPERSS